MHNPLCEGTHCSNPTGEVRLLPTGGDSNAILCHECYLHEMQFRYHEAKHMPRPVWDSLKVYEVKA